MTIEETIAAAVRAAVQPLVERLASLEAKVQPADAGYISIEKAAAFTDLHPDTIRALVKSGELPEHRAGRELRLTRAELRAYLDRSGAAKNRSSPEDEAGTILGKRRAG